ncbi:MAG: aldehyde ferredoxin oxidoreductase family protein [Planctomycetes bacterium]|nr:aldehyde ferredoxin oxidoreductase family protein [Planctomycetota bacterium]
MSGYSGTILRVNLSTSEIKKEELDSKLALKYVGGRGLGTYFIAKEVDPKADALSGANKLIFATGPLTGSKAPTGGRYMVVTKSPLSGTIASSNSGGFFGAELKKAGYDLIIFEGKSEKPCYLSIKDDQVELRDASACWGKKVSQATDLLTEASGDPKSRVAVIGPAGEKLSLIASIMNEKYRAAGRSGVGAVMGSKNLKAVVVRGTGSVESADEEKTKTVIKDILAKIKENPVTSTGLPTYGTAVLVNVINETGIYPTKNFQEAYTPSADQVSGETLAEKYLVKKTACFRCPIACGRRCQIDGVEGEGPEYETLWAYSADCGVYDLPSVIKANNLCNEYGLDTISAGATIACAMELVEKGHIKDDELDGTPLEFGSSEAIIEWTRKMGEGEGLGAKMAQGSYRFAESYGAAELSMSVKKLELPAYDPRGVQGYGLNCATTNRGGCHVRGYLISPEILSLPEGIDRNSIEGKSAWVKAFQDLTGVIDSLGMCLFTSFAIGADEYTSIFNAIVGQDWTTEKLMQAGDRIWNIERQFNLAAGIDPDQDKLPKRILEEAIPEGPSKGQASKLGEILGQYYADRGWTEAGIPTPEKLAELELA